MSETDLEVLEARRQLLDAQTKLAEAEAKRAQAEAQLAEANRRPPVLDDKHKYVVRRKTEWWELVIMILLVFVFVVVMQLGKNNKHSFQPPHPEAKCFTMDGKPIPCYP